MPVVPWDFALLVDSSKRELLVELADTHTRLANLHEDIAFNRISERDNLGLKPERIRQEGERDALIEKKFLIIRLLDAAE